MPPPLHDVTQVNTGWKDRNSISYHCRYARFYLIIFHCKRPAGLVLYSVESLLKQKWLLGREMKSKCTGRHDVRTAAADGFTEETKSKPSLSGGPYGPWIQSQPLVHKRGRCLL